jgi:hypothetical protein
MRDVELDRSGRQRLQRERCRDGGDGKTHGVPPCFPYLFSVAPMLVERSSGRQLEPAGTRFPYPHVIFKVTVS